MADVLTAVPVSSGDVVIDRRFAWARECLAGGDDAGGADLLEQVLEIAPAFAPAWFLLGEARERLGAREAAADAFRLVLKHDPADKQGAGLRLARLCGAGAPVPAAYVRALYDGYAPRFERSLVEALSYRGPDFLLRAVTAAFPGAGKFGSMLDLGCGTGLAGAVFRPHAEQMTGVDLSAGMLARARAKGIYDKLIESDVMPFLAGEAERSARHHLVVAADMLIYFDSLTPFLAAVSRVLTPTGVVAFDVETHDGAGSVLCDTLRYAHGAAHVKAALAAAGLRLLTMQNVSPRHEKGQPVAGLVVVAESA